jgi:pyruvate dehydrogenase E1 component beta subunit
LKVVLPSTPYDAKGLLKAAIRDDNPVVFFEDKMMYKLKGSVLTRYTIPLGVADVKRRRRHHFGRYAAWCKSLRRSYPEAVGISAEVVDPRTMAAG